MGTEWGKDDWKKLEKELRKQLPQSLEVNLDDSESKQISDIQKQFKSAGTSISRSEAKSYLKEVKKKSR